MAGAADARTWRIRPGPEAEQAQLQTALIEARPGDTVQLGRGRIELTAGCRSTSIASPSVAMARSARSFRSTTSVAGPRACSSPRTA
jgi:hypothetical protein